MIFQNILEFFQSYHRNEDAEWSATGVMSKQAINFGLKTAYNKFRNTETGKRMLTAKTATLIVSGGTAALPADFAELRDILGNTGAEIQRPEHQVIYDGAVAHLEIADSTYMIKYIPQPKELVNPNDVVGIPSELIESVCDYGMDFYYMWERNWVERSNNISFADKMFKERMSQIWDNTAGEHFT